MVEKGYAEELAGIFDGAKGDDMVLGPTDRALIADSLRHMAYARSRSRRRATALVLVPVFFLCLGICDLYGNGRSRANVASADAGLRSTELTVTREIIPVVDDVSLDVAFPETFE